MTTQDLRSNLAKIKENQDRLFSCKRHNFGDCPTPYHFGQTFVCLNCQGSMKAVDAFRYIQGYEAAGRNPNDILSGYREGWTPPDEDQAEGVLQRQYCNEQAMIDAAMVEMRNIVPPLRRSDCERLILAALRS